MLEVLHRVGSRVRHVSLINDQRWLWEAIEPRWQAIFRRLSSGHGFETHINDDVFRLTYEYGSRYDRRDRRVYEVVVYRALVDEIREGMTVFDIGAHVGLLTLAAAKRVGPTGRVVAFEPAPEALAALRSHICFNGYQDRAEAVGAVVSDIDRIVPFYVYRDSMSASLGRDNMDVLSPQRLGDPAFQASRIDVPSVRLDDFCATRQIQPDVVKIDVEGAELLVLRGARDMLKRKRLIVLCEIHPKQMENCGSSLNEFKTFLDSVDYTLEPLDEPNREGIFHGRITQR